ncbi:uncharacterized protein LOC112575077 isoform X2 [Pomacea canaliculata]|uniref:uncharacterized protein LOC112575077 isoform X2 n=1 Tax=Pomacea canaliculata TaxID=400727 RepID=UPI000D728184|nr:uncharacterized protein LOC112575077 isoform X2 [Pomacea canaliculata]
MLAGYHQVCHHPPIPKSVLRPHVPFVCKLCSFASHLKLEEHGVESQPDCDTNDQPSSRVLLNGSVDNIGMDLHHVLPYRMNLLTWDAQHRTNVEQCYCYCGGPGDWYCKMLQCCRCRQWFHEACVGCLKQPLLYGDRFYMFLCSHCNYGDEFIRRLPFKWVDVVHLALFNLTLTFCHKYYDLHTTILPWISENNSNLNLSNLLQSRPILSADVTRKVEAALNAHKSKFTSGKEVKKKASLWALVVRVPPQSPPVTVPASGPVNDDVMDNLNARSQKVKYFIPAQCQSPIPVKGLQRTSLDKGKSLMCKSPLVCSLLLEANNNNSTKRMVNGTGGDNCYKSLLSSPHSKNPVAAYNDDIDKQDVPDICEEKISTRSIRSNPKPPRTIDKLLATDQNSLPKQTSAVLDRLIPMPASFIGKNHPFQTEVETAEEVERLNHFQTRLAFLKKEYAADLKSSQPDKVSNPQEQGMTMKKSPSPVRGVKRGPSGEGDGVRRSKRSRVCAEQYQHLLSSFPRHAVSRQENHSAPRWKWLSVVDQILYGEKFEILGRRQMPDGSLHYLLEWDD